MKPAPRTLLASVMFVAAVGCGGGDGGGGGGGAAAGNGGGGSSPDGSGAAGPSGSGGGTNAGGSSQSANGGSSAGGNGGGAGHGGSGDGGAGASGGAGGGGGAPVDTCPVPSGAFVTEVVASGSSDVIYRRAAMQVPTNEAPHVFSTRNYGNGSFYNELLQRYTKNGAAWQATTVFDEEFGLSVASAFATSDGDDPCIVYTQDYGGNIRLFCNTLSDRVVAPGFATDLAIAAFGTTKHVARTVSQNQVQWFTTDGGDPTVPENVDAPNQTTSVSLAIDGTGRPHLAYERMVLHDAAGYHFEIRHAVRAGGTWTFTTVDTEVATSLVGEYRNVSMAMGPSDRPWIAYHRRASRSLSLVRATTNGWAAPISLEAPQPGYPNDDIGRAVALVIDCYGRGRLVYTRSVTTDPTPNSGLYHALVSGSALSGRQMVSLNGAAYYDTDHNLDYRVDASGHDHVAVMSGSLQHASR